MQCLASTSLTIWKKENFNKLGFFGIFCKYFCLCVICLNFLLEVNLTKKIETLIHLFQHFVSITLLLDGRRTLEESSVTVGIISIEYLTF